MVKFKRSFQGIVASLKKLMPILSFAIPFLILYYLYPASFESTWKGRTFYLFFLWLALLETILNWEVLKTEGWRPKSRRTVMMVVAFSLPTIYVVISNFFGLNIIIKDLALKCKIGEFWANTMPLSIEYLVFTVLFALILILEYRIGYLQEYAVSAFFLGLIGFIYVTDDLYPNGAFTPFQFLVPATATLAANFLNYLGYQTTLDMNGSMPYLSVSKSNNDFGAYIAWPCAGIESLLLYTVVILLFLRKSGIPLKQKIIYFIIGAAVTYFINILRIVTIYVIGINKGDVLTFHNYYGQLYSITWIISYLLIIIGSRALWGKIRSRTTITKPVLQPS